MYVYIYVCICTFIHNWAKLYLTPFTIVIIAINFALYLRVPVTSGYIIIVGGKKKQLHNYTHEHNPPQVGRPTLNIPPVYSHPMVQASKWWLNQLTPYCFTISHGEIPTTSTAPWTTLGPRSPWSSAAKLQWLFGARSSAFASPNARSGELGAAEGGHAKMRNILWMEEILHQLMGGLSQ